ncbi:hypothetical protein PBF_18124 [Cytobacillus firmus DS1]|uniref:Uncharacterized protein n=1 Tax=Cytobacillus firmus DS1 TaxID=1307436 RepID=W7LBY9_CYTFI|nr:hypothetical protein PBF_18124 [Cytobacillus firmus DS1]
MIRKSYTVVNRIKSAFKVPFRTDFTFNKSGIYKGLLSWHLIFPPSSRKGANFTAFPLTKKSSYMIIITELELLLNSSLFN